MKATKIIPMIVLLLLFHTKCTNKKASETMDPQKTWKAFFDENHYELNEFKEFVRANYIENDEYAKKLRVNLLNCQSHQKDIPSTICDERAIDFMNQLGIRDVAVENEYTCVEKEGLNTIFFRVERELPPQIYFIYSYCTTNNYFENSNIKIYPINGNWSLQFEN